MPQMTSLMSAQQCMATMRVPILKTTCMNGDIASKSNNRPIAMTIVASKTLELITVNRVEKNIKGRQKIDLLWKRPTHWHVHIYTWRIYPDIIRFTTPLCIMMTSSNGNIFRVTGPLCGEFTGPVNSSHKGQWRGALMFFFICAWINGWVNNREAGDLRRYHGHYDVTVMRSVSWC